MCVFYLPLKPLSPSGLKSLNADCISGMFLTNGDCAWVIGISQLHRPSLILDHNVCIVRRNISRDGLFKDEYKPRC